MRQQPRQFGPVNLRRNGCSTRGVGGVPHASSSTSSTRLRRGSPTRNRLYLRCSATQRREPLAGLHANKQLDCLAKEIAFIHGWIGKVKRLLI